MQCRALTRTGDWWTGLRELVDCSCETQVLRDAHRMRRVANVLQVCYVRGDSTEWQPCKHANGK